MDTPSLMVCVPGSGGWLSNLTALDVFCYCTALVVPLLAMPATVRSWISRQLGQGGRWPPPTVTALLCNAAWLVFGWTEKSDEAFCLNIYGGAFQIVYLATLFALCTAGERVGVCITVTIAAAFLALTATLGISHVQVELHKVLCTFYGIAAAAMPLLNVILDENRSMEMLPHWIMSSISTVHGIAWVYRGLLIANYYMAAQNLFGFFSSAAFLAAPFFWPQPTTEEVAGEYAQLPGDEDSSMAAAAAPAAADDDVHHDDDDVSDVSKNSDRSSIKEIGGGESSSAEEDYDAFGLIKKSEGSGIEENVDGRESSAEDDYDAFGLIKKSEGSGIEETTSTGDEDEDPFDLNKNFERLSINETGEDTSSNDEDEDPFDLNKNSDSAAEDSDTKPDDGNNGASENSAQEASSSADAPATPKADD